MAAKFRILMEVKMSLSKFIHDEKNEAEKKRIEEYLAFEKATALSKIQRCTEAAIIIQKHWRGYLGRQYYIYCLLKYFRGISYQHYNSMIIKIQKVWRGYYIRRHVYDFHRRKGYLEALVEKNEKILARLKEIDLERQRAEFERALIIEHKYQSELCRKSHYLLSTKAIPGIYNSPKNPNDNRDTLLRAVKFYRSPSPKKRKQLRLATKAKKILDPLKNLPNVPPKPQGPFRDPKEVQIQRYKPIRQTLRMETDFYHLERARLEMKDEEWTQRHHDDIFLPVKNRDSRYRGNVVHRYSRYVPPGQRYLRLENPSLNIDEKDFKLVLSPIPLFDVYEEKMEEMELMKLR